MLRVRDIMNKDVVYVAPSAPVTEVARKMRDWGVGVAVVCERGEFCGVITERDVVGLVAAERNPQREYAGSLVAPDLPMISDSEEVVQAAQAMINRGVRVLPVAQNQRFVGLLTLDDLARECLALGAAVLAGTARPLIAKG